MSNQVACMSDTRKSKLSSKDRIIFALDFQSLKEATPLIRDLKDHVGLFKVGLTLLLSEGIKVINQIQDITGDQKAKTFLDLKLGNRNDIPNQMLGMLSVLISSSPGVEFITVHMMQGEKIVKEVVDKFKNETKVLGVTVLTSTSEEESKSLYGTDVLDSVIALSNTAKEAGCNGVVCSGREVKAIKKLFGHGFITVTPGIRPSWSRIPNDDQRRVTTPREAIENGADYIVVGRPISLDKDPVGAADRISEEIAQALEQPE